MKKEKDLSVISLFSVKGEKLSKYRMSVIHVGNDVKLINQYGSAQISVHDNRKGYVVKTGFKLIVTFTNEEFEKFNSGEVIYKEIKHTNPDLGTEVIKQHHFANSVEALTSLFPGKFDDEKVQCIKDGTIIAVRHKK